MSKYLLNKFLYTVDRDPVLIERYRDDPSGTVTWWEQARASTTPTICNSRSKRLNNAPRDDG